MSINIIPELPADRWDLDLWVEQMASTNPAGSFAFTSQDSEASIVIEVPFNKVRSAYSQIIGWAWADDAAPYELHRPYVPLQHPRFPNLWADSITVTDRHPLPNTDFSSGSGAGITYKAKVASVGFPYPYSPDYTAKYAMSYLTVRFKPLKTYRVFDDADPEWANNYSDMEWMRFFGREGTDVRLDLITAEGANDDNGLVFAEGAPGAGSRGTGPATGSNGQKWPGAVFVRKETTDFHMIWRQVPINFTCGQIMFDAANIASFLMPQPTRLINALGKLNELSFPGTASPYLPGTLMLTAVKETIYQQPLRTDTEFGLFAADYAMTFSHFDPPRDPNAETNPNPLPVGMIVASGHDLFPYRGTRYWYLATSGANKGTYNGNFFYDRTDFHKIFQARENTTLYPILP